MITRLYQFFCVPVKRYSDPRVIFWLTLSLTLATFYSLLALQQAFAGEYVIQDDARQHVFWMQRFIEPGLFPNDLITDYFQSVAPYGYSAFYRLFALFGIEPIFLSKCLPIVLSLMTTAYCFSLCLLILPVPAAGFFSTLLLNQNLWLRDDLVSATPAAFVYPLWLAFLYYLLRRAFLACCLTIALLGLFYPQCIFIAAGVLFLRLWHWDRGRLRLSKARSDNLFYLVGLGVAVLILLPYALNPSEFGPVTTAAQARALPAFSATGWSSFFVNDFWMFWICGKRSGMLPYEWCRIIRDYSILLLPLQTWLSLLLPVLLLNPSKFPLTQHLKHIKLLPQILIASGGMFVLAHLFIFKLHLPNRYTEHTLRIVVALAAGMTLALLLEALLQFCRQRNRSLLALGGLALAIVMLVLYPEVLKAEDHDFPVTRYSVGGVPKLYEFFQSQPKDILIASIADEVNNLPSFAERSILVGGEGYVLPYHLGYYNPIYDRMLALIKAQYSQELGEVQQFIQEYGVDFWLLEKTAFTPQYIADSNWKGQYPLAARDAIAPLQQGAVPALAQTIPRCSVFKADNLIVLEAKCIMQGF